MFGLGFGELAVILVLVILLFGAKRIPSLAKGMGEAMREFKNAKEDSSSKKSDEDSLS
ncbi:MAG: twin-arginine translocase TatA/TatE family subunit [Bacteriovorax sp.]|nr:twin-arginine translocase TatA/TatE family subunit [Bacteriovorax sp.]